MDAKNYTTNVINFFVGLAGIILGLRIIFRLFDANPNASFVNWIYDTSSVIMEPFRGIFSPAVIERGYVLDIPAIFAALMYMVIGLLLIALVGMIPGVENKPARK